MTAVISSAILDATRQTASRIGSAFGSEGNIAETPNAAIIAPTHHADVENRIIQSLHVV